MVRWGFSSQDGDTPARGHLSGIPPPLARSGQGGTPTRSTHLGYPPPKPSQDGGGYPSQGGACPGYPPARSGQQGTSWGYPCQGPHPWYPLARSGWGTPARGTHPGYPPRRSGWGYPSQGSTPPPAMSGWRGYSSQGVPRQGGARPGNRNSIEIRG